jgi:hypothetical protein
MSRSRVPGACWTVGTACFRSRLPCVGSWSLSPGNFPGPTGPREILVLVMPHVTVWPGDSPDRGSADIAIPGCDLRGHPDVICAVRAESHDRDSYLDGFRRLDHGAVLCDFATDTPAGAVLTSEWLTFDHGLIRSSVLLYDMRQWPVVGTAAVPSEPAGSRAPSSARSTVKVRSISANSARSRKACGPCPRRWC